MEIVLRGTIKSLVKDFGFISCEMNKTDYFFHQTNLDKENNNLKIGNQVSFQLKANVGREGFQAIEIKIIQESNEIILIESPKKKLKYFFESQTDMIMGFRHIKDKLEFQKSKCTSNYEDSEEIIYQIQELLDILNDLLIGPNPNFEDISYEDLNCTSSN
jgi:cold shock CspA family protein